MIADYVLGAWGWETFFTELTAFLRQLEEEEGIANLSFAEYVLECLCVATVCVSNMQSVLIAA